MAKYRDHKMCEFKHLDDPQYVLMMCCGNRDAVRFSMDILYVSHIMDDLVDTGSLGKEQAYKLFNYLMFDIPRNPFYMANFHVLNPIMAAGMHAWKIANVFEAQKSNQLCELSHVMRYGVADILPIVAEICGGREHAEKVGPEMRLRTHNENLPPYQKEHTACLP